MKKLSWKFLNSLEELGLLLKSTSEIIENEPNKKIGLLEGTPGASWLKSMLADKLTITTSQRQETTRAGKGTITEKQEV